MIRVLKFFATFLCCFILQSLFEIILMSVLAKLGVPYLDIEVRGESFKEIIEVISVYYFYSKLFYITPFYFVITITFGLVFFRNKEVSFKNAAIVHIGVNVFIFLVLWFGFGNGFGFIANPFLGLLLAGLLIYLIASQFRSPLVRHKSATLS